MEKYPAKNLLFLWMLWSVIQKPRFNSPYNMLYKAPELKRSFESDENFNPRKIPEDLVKKLIVVLDEKEYYTDPTMTLQKLARILCTNTSTLSNAINAYYGVPFRTVLNQKRIELIQEMILSGEYDNLCLKGIAETAGYLNKSTFHKQFKFIVGLSPYSYKKKVKKMRKKRMI